MKKSSIINAAFFFVLIFAAFTFLTLNKHSRSGLYNYHSEIFGDKAGYYIYLPATFEFGFDGEKMPDQIDSLTGFGFKVIDKKIQTKYPYGVSLMQLPFYLIANGINFISGNDENSFSLLHHKLIDIAAVTYLTLSLLLLYLTLKKDFSKKASIFTLASLFLGTNLFYYGIVETGMSHIYSFFLFSSLLFITRKIKEHKIISTQNTLLLGLIVGSILITRPSNILALMALLFLYSNSRNDLIHRFKLFTAPKVLLTITTIALLIFIPQVVYWKYSYGSFLMDTYSNESFNWLQPQIIKVLFSPLNGLFLYGSIYLIVVISTITFIRRNLINSGYFILFSFVLLISASWWSWEFGCAYGGRNFTEYLAIFIIPFVYSVEKMMNQKRLISKVYFGTLMFLMAINLKLVYTFDQCFFGEGHWDWQEYFHLLTGPTI